MTYYGMVDWWNANKPYFNWDYCRELSPSQATTAVQNSNQLFKNGTCKTCSFKFSDGCIPQILSDPLLNTLSNIIYVQNKSMCNMHYHIYKYYKYCSNFSLHAQWVAFYAMQNNAKEQSNSTVVTHTKLQDDSKFSRQLPPGKKRLKAKLNSIKF